MHQMVDFSEQNGNLVISPVDGMEDDLQECSDLSEALEYQLCNGWGWIDPSEIGALTSGEIVSRETVRDDHGELTECGTIYWNASYMVVDTLDMLKSGESVSWVGKH